MTQALRCGCTIAEYWDMTPQETYAVIEAINWREKQQERQRMSIAWLTTVLSRKKRIPSLKMLLAGTKRPERPTKAQLRERRKEFKDVATPENVRRINEAMRKQ